MDRRITVVIGKNFGDEGKGLATAYFAGQSSHSLVVKHNGGAQAGHTVDRTDGRFVFHQLSSGSFCGASTYLSSTFLPDLLKLPEEAEAFRIAAGHVPTVYLDAQCRLTTVFDVVLNALAESSREGARHGSCGMGIHESILRNETPEYALSLGEFETFSPREAALFLEKVRTEYVPVRLQQLSRKVQEDNAWCDLLRDSNVARNAAEAMKSASRYFSMIHDAKELILTAENLIYEGAQGLLLDRNNRTYWPHLTPSDTGSKNPFALLNQCGISYNKSNTEVCYVTRSYVTRHGAGPLPHECDRAEISPLIHDQTNVENQWQETLRFARHPGAGEFVRAIEEDQKHYVNSDDPETREKASVSLMITHLNETDGRIVNEDAELGFEVYLSHEGMAAFFDKVYTAYSPFSESIQRVK